MIINQHQYNNSFENIIRQENRNRIFTKSKKINTKPPTKAEFVDIRQLEERYRIIKHHYQDYKIINLINEG